MNTAQEILKEVAALSEEHQAEVLDFIAFLAAREAEDREDFAVFEERASEPTRPFDEVLADMKTRGLL